jgi:hypothetical protein
LADVLEETAGEVREARTRYDDQATRDVGGVGADSAVS